MKAALLLLLPLLLGGSSLVGAVLDSSLFTGCGNTTTCFLVVPSNCAGGCSGPDCDLVAIIENIPSQSKFRIQLHSDRDYSYMAIGFSLDRLMGFSDVVGCDKSNASIANAKDTYNIAGRFNEYDGDQSGISNFTANINGSNFSCTFDRTYLSPPGAGGYSLNSGSYFLFLATRVSGFSTAIQRFAMHSDTPCISGSPVNLLQPGPVVSTGRDLTLVKAHGLLMIFAWLVLVCTAAFLASFTKHVFPNGEWFHAHRLLNISGLVVAVIAFIIIFVYVGGWSVGSNVLLAHQVSGIASFVIILLNPILSLFRCSPTDEYRWVFSLVHGTLGHLGLVFAQIAIGLGLSIYYSYIGKDIFQAVAFWVFIGWIAVNLFFYFVLHLYRIIKSVNENKRQKDKLMKEKPKSEGGMLQALKHNFLCLPLCPPFEDRKKAAKEWPFVGTILFAFIACTLLFYVACVLTIILI